MNVNVQRLAWGITIDASVLPLDWGQLEFHLFLHGSLNW